MPKVSVIVPSYNHARYLPKRVESVLRQTYQDFELILLDDCSMDDSRSVLLRYAGDERVRLEFNEANSGSPFKQWNKGVRLSRGKYVWLAESDDYADRTLLARLVGILESDETIAYAYCRSWRMTADGHLVGFEDSYLPHQGPRGWAGDYCVDGERESRDYFLFINPVPNASASVFRRATYESIGGADESLILCGDWKLWAALALTGRVAYLAEPLNYYRWHETTQRGRTERRSVSVAESLQVVRWITDRLKLSEAERVAVYNAHAAGWVPELMSFRISLKTKGAILRNAKALDPHPAQRILRPALDTLRRSIVHRWQTVRSVLFPAREGA